MLTKMLGEIDSVMLTWTIKKENVIKPRKESHLLQTKLIVCWPKLI